MTVMWADNLDRLYIYRHMPRRDQGIVYKIGPHTRHWGAFAEKCINNRTIRHDTNRAEPIVYCYRKMHLWGCKSHAVYSIPLCFFFLGRSAYLGTMSKIRAWSYYNGYITGRGDFLGGAWEWFQRSYIIVTPCFWYKGLWHNITGQISSLFSLPWHNKYIASLLTGNKLITISWKRLDC